MEKICAFTGHRPSGFDFRYNENDPHCLAVKERIMQETEKHIRNGFCVFYSGMAEGADIWAAEAVMRLKATYPHIRLIAAVPFIGQRDHLHREYIDRYDKIISSCDGVAVISEKFIKSCYRKRNRFMVDKCDALIAIYDESKYRSGSAQTVRYARSVGKDVTVISWQK